MALLDLIHGRATSRQAAATVQLNPRSASLGQFSLSLSLPLSPSLSLSLPLSPSLSLALALFLTFPFAPRASLSSPFKTEVSLLQLESRATKASGRTAEACFLVLERLVTVCLALELSLAVVTLSLYMKPMIRGNNSKLCDRL